MPGERPKPPRPEFVRVPLGQIQWRTIAPDWADPPKPAAKPVERGFAYRTIDGTPREYFPGDLPKLILRSDGRVEQICEHGVGHPVGTAGVRWDPAWMGVHGCCGCCRLELPPGAEETRG